ncbi:CidA/LrgA family protein [Tardiphaga sp. 538_B7_N1_4]|jgi:putative effector of murein hydrolase LrgA (UPF0299 family)|uniref:CidA/LrgA family protein n=1 Tax=unclassified Tardiphaga TaxID=2631404 RepID=UPI001B8A72AC|nr:CidA/LrgA family protein [Bradyrhizobium diazoefficiens]MBR0967302.1 CidA/LrgA family protein [Bradyrhizobium diazoefficiens]MBR0976623.1 CidA/LrgA family protein [Bradyrhizobium diazoefficiens]MBR1005268.1 CidA/LrgA family protein [Bradyrhizobium diazoefficiens]MBR1011741.1 CidA/LrgA family protein [Bradyrhizobium diazoefficiens]MBR1049082.1 CidA/LrgA family protein [Bradyrhizobium diazoefficiens]
MIVALFLLLVAELAGELIREFFDLAIPGPVIGMFLLAAVLVARNCRQETPSIPSGLGRTTDALIGHMGLLFVPAGVGVITEAGLLEKEWLPILLSLVGSTILSLAVTGLVMHWTIRSVVAPDPSGATDPVLAQPEGKGS